MSKKIQWYNRLEPYRIEHNISEEYRDALTDRVFILASLFFIMGLSI